MASKGLLSRVMMGGALAAGGALWALAPRLAHERKGLGIREVPDVLYAHRGLHDAGSGLTEAYAAHSGEYVALARRMALQAGYGTADFLGPLAPENSMAAFAAACEAGYGIELDIQLTADGQVAVVHDADLLRVAGDPRRVENLSYEELSRIALFPAPAKPGDSKVRNAAADASAFLDSDDAIADAIGEETAAPQGYYQHVPLFADVLNLVDGRVPLIVEYKFDTMRWDERCTELMEQGDALLRAYAGPYAVESFMPRAMGWYKRIIPKYVEASWPWKPNSTGLRRGNGLPASCSEIGSRGLISSPTTGMAAKDFTSRPPVCWARRPFRGRYAARRSWNAATNGSTGTSSRPSCRDSEAMLAGLALSSAEPDGPEPRPE